MLRAVAATLAVAPVVGFATVWGAKYLVHAFALRPVDCGRYLWLPPLLFNLGAIACGDLASRRDRNGGRPSPALFAAGVALTAMIALVPRAVTPAQAIALISVANAGGGALYTLITGDLLARIPADSAARASAAIVGAQSLSAIVAHPLIGAAVDRLESYDPILIAHGIWLLPGSVLWCLGRRTRNAVTA